MARRLRRLERTHAEEICKMRSVLAWLLAKHRRHYLLSYAFDAARSAFWTLQADPEKSVTKKSFLQLNPRLDLRVRGRIKRPRGYDYPELQEKDAAVRLLLVRQVLVKQLQLQ
jgi:hypothetical protein